MPNEGVTERKHEGGGWSVLTFPLASKYGNPERGDGIAAIRLAQRVRPLSIRQGRREVRGIHEARNWKATPFLMGECQRGGGGTQGSSVVFPRRTLSICSPRKVAEPSLQLA